MSLIAAIVLLAIALGVGYLVGRAASRKGAPAPPLPPPEPPAPLAASRPVAPDVPQATPPSGDAFAAEHARIIRSLESETASLRRELAARSAESAHRAELADDRRRLFGELASARGEAARYRQLVADLESDAPPPFFGAGAPDDLKLIVGIGPVLERLLQQLGIATYRQIARWSERDIDEFDARLEVFPGRIRRDGWVAQARALHQSKYGETLPTRDRSPKAEP